MAIPVVVVGCNHDVAPIELRERLAITKSAMPSVLERFLLAGIGEVFILSTCNRIEVYALATNPEIVLDILADLRSVDRAQLDGVLYRFADAAAVRHLFTVAAGLDSMVIGEVEILGQIRAALDAARAVGAVGKLLDRLVTHALAAGKRVRAETDISTRATSVSNAAFELTKHEVPSIHDTDVLVLGAGEIAESTARIFASHSVRRLYFANRTSHRSKRLAERYGGRAVSYINVSPWLETADVVITATDAPHTVIRSRQVQSVMARRDGRPLRILDLAVPRDVEPTVAALPNVSLFNVDDLQRVIDRNLAGRRASSTRARRIVNEEVENFVAWSRSLCAVPTICAFREAAELTRQVTLDEFSRALAGLTTAQQTAVERLTRRLVSRLTHQPTVGLKAVASVEPSALDAARSLLISEGGRRNEP